MDFSLFSASVLIVSMCGVQIHAALNFSPAFLAQQDRAPVQSQKSDGGTATVKRSLDIISLGYALSMTCSAYYLRMVQENRNPSTLSTIAQVITPSFLRQTTAHGLFFADVCGIVAKTLLYKTVARLLWCCYTNDYFSLFS